MQKTILAAVAALALSAGSAFAQSNMMQDLTVFGFHHATTQAATPSNSDGLTVFGFRAPASTSTTMAG